MSVMSHVEPARQASVTLGTIGGMIHLHTHLAYPIKHPLAKRPQNSNRLLDQGVDVNINANITHMTMVSGQQLMALA